MSAKKITEPPKNVKEAIDWLIRIGEWDNKRAGRANVPNASAIQNAIKKLTGSTSNTFQSVIQTLISDLSKFIGYKNGNSYNGEGIIKKDGNYSSAYEASVKWPTCKPAGACSGCTQGSKCNCQSGGKSCDGSCCNTCDIRICAGIFVALVPALHTALEDLKKKCNAKGNNSKKIYEEPLKGYFTALGFDGEQLNNALTGNIASSKLWSATRKLNTIKDRISGAFKNNTGRNGFTATTTVVDASQSPSSTPRTIREMLLWLMGLPYCEGYGEFVKKLKTDPYKSIVSSSTGKSKDDHYLHRQLSAVIFHLPTVFYSVEGGISYLNEVFEQFKKDDAKPRFHYPNGQDGTDMLNTLSAYVAVCYPILKYLMQRCDKVNGRRGARGPRSAAQGTTTPTDEKDGAWGELMVSGQDNSSATVQSKAASGSSAPPTALKDFLVFMGFQTPTGTMTGDDLYENALKECFSDTMKNDDEDEDDKAVTSGVARSRLTSKDQKLPALRKLAKHVLQEAHGSAGAGGASGGGSSPNGTTPTTIRQMMLWLIGLPLTAAYKKGSDSNKPAGTGALFGQQGLVVTGIKNNDALKELEKGQSGTRSTRTTSTVTGKHFKQQLKDSIVGMIMLFQRIEGGLKSVLEFLKGGFKDTNGGGSQNKFKYEGFNDNKTILDVLGSYVYKVHTQLRFLKVMCKTGKNDGGWQECEFESDGGSLFQGITCSCSNSFLGSSCPTPLRHYLNGNGKNKFTNGENIPSMCFNMKYLKTDKRLTGASITPYLEALLEDIPTPTPQSQSSPKPLSLLTQYCVAIGRIDPSSLGDHFDVFQQLANGMWDKIKGTVKESIKSITQGDNDGSQASGKLQGALKEVWPGSHNGGTHDGDLASLTGCNGSAPNCTPFVASLSHGLYKYCDPSKLQSPAQKIDWLYMKMSGLYGKLTKLLGDMRKECKCCKDKDSSSSSSCKGITQCPNCLPLLYKMGLVFGSAETLTTGKSGAKKCRELMEKMKKVLDATSKLCLLFTKIEDGRFKPYLLFSAMVVKGKKGLNGQSTGDDDNYNCYTHALVEYYEPYLDGKKKELEKTAQGYKKTREGHLACACDSHEYNAPKPGPGTPTTVTLTLYFHKDGVTTKLELKAPHHGPTYNPLVRFYPRNLKSIVDWLLRIGQTRLEQGTSAASTNDALENNLGNIFPKIQGYVTGIDQNTFKALVKKVMNMMGLKNQGKQEVKSDVDGKLQTVQDALTKKLNGGNGDGGFTKTFNSILTFNPKLYLNEVIKDFGERVKSINTNGEQKDRSFNCIAKAVTKCMSESLKKIQKLATENKTTMDKYGITDIEDLKDVNIESVNELTSIENLKTLCDGFKQFHDVYTIVTGAFNGHLKKAQKNGASTEWQKITKCVEAFNELGKCVQELGELNGMSSHDKMQEASMKLEKISDKLNEVHEKLNGDDIQTFTEKVTEFIKQLDDVLKKEGEKALEKALESALKGKSSSNTFSDFLKSYVSKVIEEMKQNKVGSDDNKVCDIHLRVRNDLQQLSECLKVMCEVCGTGMKDFANELKECVDKGKDHLDGIKDVKTKLQELKNNLGDMNGKDKQEQMSQLSNCISTIEQLLKNEYIYNPPPILNKLITEHDKMTKYLKQLPDLIRDRYVLQKWQDSPEVFCGVQRFEGGIVKNSDTEEIKKKLKELLKEDFNKNNDTQFSITIHEFQVRALIYNFCHKEGIKGIGEGLDVMESVKKALENVNQNPPKPQGDVDWNNIKTNKDKLSPLLKNLSDNAYLRYFATHLRDSIGYHTLSNTLGALEQVKAALEKNPSSQQPNGWDKIKDLLKKDAMKQLHDRLDALVKQLNREYIFEYPPFDWQKSCHRLVREQAAASRARRSADGSPSPTSPTTCDLCVPSMAYIFIGFVPQMYRLFKMLREMTKEKGYGRTHKLELTNNGTDASTTTMSSLAGILSREGWRLKLGSDMTKDVEVFPFDLDDTKTGKDICTLLQEIIGNKEPGALVAQGEASTDPSLKPLDKLFKAVMQHFKDERNKKKTEREQALKKAFEQDQQRTKSGLTFQAPPPVLPSTVRQVLFWLHEMDTNKAFYDGMSQHIHKLCQRSSTVDISHDNILHVLNLSITQCLEVLATIEDPGRQNADYYYELYTEEHYYAYPTVNIPLFFYTFVEKLMGAFLELNFVCVQCEFRATEGGWSECHIGKSEHSMEGQNCRCTKPHTKASPLIPVTVSGSVVCPRPLSAFLFSDQKNQLRIPSDVSQRLAYMSKGTMPCGFQLKNKAITDATSYTPASTSMTGSVLVEPLRKLVGGHVKGRHSSTTTRKDDNNTLNTVIYLRDLLRYTLCLAVRPPWSMSENMAFFYRVTESWKQKGVGSVALRNDKLLGAIHAEIALFPGTFDGKKLTSAVERFAGIEDNKHQNNRTHSNMSHHYDLRTLMGCKENTATGSGTTPQCSPFMFPLSLDVYTHYDHRNSRAYLSWILNFAFGIYGQLRGLEEMMKEQKCMRNASKSKSDCPSLPMCPGVLTALYQSGSSFMDQKVLADVNTNAGGATTTGKTCNDFHSVLSGLFNCDSRYCTPLHNLIVQCEAFLWSIRMPFSLVQLSLWSVAILFISYVFVVPLDHFKIKSHLFNRLKYTMHPSLLIADQQRRVSEVAYFSL